MRSALAPTTLLILVLCGGCGAGNSPSQFEAGMKALREGNYAEAYCRWRPLAERGECHTELLLAGRKVGMDLVGFAQLKLLCPLVHIHVGLTYRQ